ncbi:MAG: lysophospholipid acyltransferase family protein [Planctomycetota bacterium]
MWAYRLLRALLRIAVRVFYRQVEVVGLENVPAEGPVIFAGNHPNSLIDPMLLVATCGRIVQFAAKDTLFESRLLRVFLNALGAVPIRRKMDHAGESLDNSAAFDALFGVLEEGRAVGIFPEGISHDEAQLARLKTGAARIALGSKGRRPEAPLRVVPCGLTYIHRRHFRSRVLVQYGPPIDVPVGGVAPEAVQALTEEIERGLRALTINAPDWDTLRLLDGVRRLYQPPRIPLAHRVELARRFATVYEKVKGEPEIAAIAARVQRYLDRLEDAGFTDHELALPIRPLQLFERTARELVWCCVWLPLAAPGVLIHAPVGILVGVGGHYLTPRKDVLATTKLMLGILLVVASHAAMLAAAFWWVGWEAALAVFVLLPLSGYALIRVLERAASLRRVLTRVARAFVLGRERQELIAERAALEAEIVRAVDRFRPPEMELLYPHDAPPGGTS